MLAAATIRPDGLLERDRFSNITGAKEAAGGTK
jgi:hypothetical protein